MSTTMTYRSKLARLIPDTAELHGTLALTCGTPECEVMSLDVRLNTAGDFEGQLSLDAAGLRCPACGAQLIPHRFMRETV